MTSVVQTSPAPECTIRVHKGDCWVFFALDAAYAIDLDEAQRLLSLGGSRAGEATHREAITHQKRSPAHLQFRPAPLRIDQPCPEVGVLDLAGFHASPQVECTLFDFGAVSVAYRIPLEGGGTGLPLTSLTPLAQRLFDCTDLREDAQARVRLLTSRLAGAFDRPSLHPFVEDYTVYHARVWTTAQPAHAEEALTGDSRSVAALLLAEPDGGALSDQSVASALSTRVSYSHGDATVIDWNAALALGADESDTLAVLEFANVELLQMRLLDDRLDAALDRSYSALLRRDSKGRMPRSPLGLLMDPNRAERRRLAALQMENAVLFEGVNNALKLIGDEHLARLYAAAARRFHLGDWDLSILRKLRTVDELYQKLAEEASARRMEVLEWIIIILIAASMVIPFLPGVGGT
ncbi:MAG: hypothetical protein DYG92_04235 [Leptolyngbya sp. PLA1]|nr:hypothetical protein [Leptolyngbya sp. PLA1]